MPGGNGRHRCTRRLLSPFRDQRGAEERPPVAVRRSAEEDRRRDRQREARREPRQQRHLALDSSDHHLAPREPEHPAPVDKPHRVVPPFRQQPQLRRLERVELARDQPVRQVPVNGDLGAPLVHRTSVSARVADQPLGAIPASATWPGFAASCGGARGRELPTRLGSSPAGGCEPVRARLGEGRRDNCSARAKRASRRDLVARTGVVPSERLGQGHRRRSLMPRCESQAGTGPGAATRTSARTRWGPGIATIASNVVNVERDLVRLGARDTPTDIDARPGRRTGPLRPPTPPKWWATAASAGPADYRAERLRRRRAKRRALRKASGLTRGPVPRPERASGQRRRSGPLSIR